MPVRGISEAQVQDLGIFLGLGQPIRGMVDLFFGFYHCNWEIPAVVQQIIGALLHFAYGASPGRHNPPVGEGDLLADLVVILPAGLVQPGRDVLSARIRFAHAEIPP